MDRDDDAQPAPGKTGSESSGAAYPNPHDDDHEDGGGTFDGGQSRKSYHGTGQLGETDTGDNENAVTSEDD